MPSTRASLEPCPAGRRTGAKQPVAQLVHQLGVRFGLGEFELPLTPPLLDFWCIGGGGPRRGDLVVAEFSQHRVVGAVELVDVPRGGYSRDRAQRAVPDNCQHDVHQLGRHIFVALFAVAVRGTQRCAHLGAGVGSCRQLQVPTGIYTAGATAQRDSSGRQITRRGVEVHGVQCLRRGPLHPKNVRDTGERWRAGGLADVELALHLEITRRARGLDQTSSPHGSRRLVCHLVPVSEGSGV